jgi:hypothetical protein
MCWKEAKGLWIEPNTTYRNHKESDHMSLIDHPIINPTWTTFLPGLPIKAGEENKTLPFCPV